jgi:hypothetical protein
MERPVTDREALARLTAALDAYFAMKGTGDWMGTGDWTKSFNALLAALAEARRVLAEAQQ